MKMTKKRALVLTSLLVSLGGIIGVSFQNCAKSTTSGQNEEASLSKTVFSEDFEGSNEFNPQVSYPYSDKSFYRSNFGSLTFLYEGCNPCTSVGGFRLVQGAGPDGSVAVEIKGSSLYSAVSFNIDPTKRYRFSYDARLVSTELAFTWGITTSVFTNQGTAFSSGDISIKPTDNSWATYDVVIEPRPTFVGKTYILEFQITGAIIREVFHFDNFRIEEL
jgi:hypothetical protein